MADISGKTCRVCSGKGGPSRGRACPSCGVRPCPVEVLGKYIALCDEKRCRGDLLCTFAHSDKERAAWVVAKDAAPTKGPSVAKVVPKVVTAHVRATFTEGPVWIDDAFVEVLARAPGTLSDQELFAATTLEDQNHGADVLNGRDDLFARNDKAQVMLTEMARAAWERGEFKKRCPPIDPKKRLCKYAGHCRNPTCEFPETEFQLSHWHKTTTTQVAIKHIPERRRTREEGGLLLEFGETDHVLYCRQPSRDSPPVIMWLRLSNSSDRPATLRSVKTESRKDLFQATVAVAGSDDTARDLAVKVTRHQECWIKVTHQPTALRTASTWVVVSVEASDGSTIELAQHVFVTALSEETLLDFCKLSQALGSRVHLPGYDPSLCEGVPFRRDEVVPLEREATISHEEKGLEEYPLPPWWDKLLTMQAFHYLDPEMTADNHATRLRVLLFLEEHQLRQECAEFNVKAQHLPAVKNRDPCIRRLKIAQHMLLGESRPSLLQRDLVYVKDTGSGRVFEGEVALVEKEAVLIRFAEGEEAAEVQRAGARFDCFFTAPRLGLRQSHRALCSIDSRRLFPTAAGVLKKTWFSGGLRRDALHDASINDEQFQVVDSVLNSKLTRIPTIVCGPFGTGKSRTIEETVQQLLASSANRRIRILLCTHANTAADAFVEGLARRLPRARDFMFRLLYEKRMVDTVTPAVRPFARFSAETSSFVLPPVHELESFRVVVCTMSAAGALTAAGIRKGHFTHIVIDEAAQANEVTAVIPLVLADDMTKIVLAGDHQQMGLPVRSDIARNYGLQCSLLERLFDNPVYKEPDLASCSLVLIQNYRSHPRILQVCSDLFYKKSLKACARIRIPRWDRLPNADTPLLVVDVPDGEETREYNSPSFYNNREAETLVELVVDFVRNATTADGEIDLEEICVLAPFHRQVQEIRRGLRDEGLGAVEVHRVENVQGLEYKYLFLSPVRTSLDWEEYDKRHGIGLTNNDKVFNTAITRASSLVVAVCCTRVVCQDPPWNYLAACAAAPAPRIELPGVPKGRAPRQWSDAKPFVPSKQLAAQAAAAAAAAPPATNGVKGKGKKQAIQAEKAARAAERQAAVQPPPQQAAPVSIHAAGRPAQAPPPGLQTVPPAPAPAQPKTTTTPPPLATPSPATTPPQTAHAPQMSSFVAQLGAMAKASHEVFPEGIERDRATSITATILQLLTTHVVALRQFGGGLAYLQDTFPLPELVGRIASSLSHAAAETCFQMEHSMRMCEELLAKNPEGMRQNLIPAPRPMPTAVLPGRVAVAVPPGFAPAIPVDPRLAEAVTRAAGNLAPPGLPMGSLIPPGLQLVHPAQLLDPRQAPHQQPPPSASQVQPHPAGPPQPPPGFGPARPPHPTYAPSSAGQPGPLPPRVPTAYIPPGVAVTRAQPAAHTLVHPAPAPHAPVLVVPPPQAGMPPSPWSNTAPVPQLPPQAHSAAAAPQARVEATGASALRPPAAAAPPRVALELRDAVSAAGQTHPVVVPASVPATHTSAPASVAATAAAAMGAALHRCPVLVTEVVDHQTFFAQLAGEENTAPLVTLMTRAAEFNASEDADVEPRLLPFALVFARFTTDDLWYRALVLNTLEDDACLVRYIDYGNSETLPIDRLRVLPNEFQALPPQARECRLPPSDLPADQRARAGELLRELIHGKQCLLSAEPPDAKNGQWRVTVLESAAIPDVARALDRLLEHTDETQEKQDAMRQKERKRKGKAPAEPVGAASTQAPARATGKEPAAAAAQAPMGPPTVPALVPEDDAILSEYQEKSRRVQHVNVVEPGATRRPEYPPTTFPDPVPIERYVREQRPPEIGTVVEPARSVVVLRDAGLAVTEVDKNSGTWRLVTDTPIPERPNRPPAAERRAVFFTEADVAHDRPAVRVRTGPNEKYWPREQVEVCIERGIVVVGALRVSRADAGRTCYISHDSFDQDIKIPGRFCRNRAFEGDEVAVKLLSKVEARACIVASSGDDGDGDELDDDGDTHPLGRVVAVLAEHHNTTCVCMARAGDGDRLLTPMDRAIPQLICHEKIQQDEAESRLYLVRLGKWGVGEALPRCKLLKVIDKPRGDDFRHFEEVYKTEYAVQPAPEPSPALVRKYPMNWVPAKTDLKSRTVSRRVAFTIDPPGAQDLDDALSVEQRGENTLVGIHIADVSHFVTPDSEVDKEAAKRCTSVYLKTHNVPMLPRPLSENAASLLPGKQRLVLTCEAVVDPDGRLVGTPDFRREAITSRCRLTYDEAQAALDAARNNEQPPVDANVVDALVRLADLARALRARRIASGSVEIARVEQELEADEDGGVGKLRVGPDPSQESHDLVMEFMVLANTAAAECLLDANRPVPLRVHPHPPRAKLIAFEKWCKDRGMFFDDYERPDFDSCEVDPGLVALARDRHRRLATTGAQYILPGDVHAEWRGHYALGARAYTHFTSPLRRYADIVVHRALLAALAGDDDAVLAAEPMDTVCTRINTKTRNARLCQRDALDTAVSLSLSAAPCVAYAVVEEAGPQFLQLMLPALRSASARTLRVELRELQGNAQWVPEEGVLRLRWQGIDGEEEEDRSGRYEILSRNSQPCVITRDIREGTVVRIQMGGCTRRVGWVHMITGVEWAPQRMRCLHHNHVPSILAPSGGLRRAQEQYSDAQEYFATMKYLLLREAASSAVRLPDEIVNKKGEAREVPSPFITLRNLRVTFAPARPVPDREDPLVEGRNIPYDEGRAPRRVTVPAEAFVSKRHWRIQDFELRESDFVCVRVGGLECDHGAGNPPTFDRVSRGAWIGHGYVSTRTRKTDVFSFILEGSATDVPSGEVDAVVEIIPISYPHKRMLSALDAADLSENNPLLRHICLKDGITVAGDPEPHPPLAADWTAPGQPPLDIYQIEAVRHALQSRFSLIQGPPGTGKTVTGVSLARLFAIANQRRAAGEKVLYCAPANKPVDVVARMMLKGMGAECKVLRVYARSIEDTYAGVFKSTKRQTDDDVPTDLHAVALHVLIRSEGTLAGKLRHMEERMKALDPPPSRYEEDEQRARLVTSYIELIRQAEMEFLVQADIICCTSVTAGDTKRFENTVMAQVIVDEAAQSIEPESLIPLRRATRRVVLIGDHQQLEPVVTCQEPSIMHDLELSLFERHKDEAVMLRIQYRMHAAIRAFPSEAFYEDQLLDADEVGERNQLAAQCANIWPRGPAYPIAFFDVRGRESKKVVRDVNEPDRLSAYASLALRGAQGSTCNEEEALQVLEIVRRMLAGSVNPGQILVVTSYKAQRVLINLHLMNAGIKGVEAVSVNAAQGSERDFVILSTVRSLLPGEATPVHSVLGFIANYRHVNVALTRARHGLCIVGNAHSLETNNKTWRNLIQHYRRHECLVDPPKRPARARGAVFAIATPTRPRERVPDEAGPPPVEEVPPEPEPEVAAVEEEAAPFVPAVPTRRQQLAEVLEMMRLTELDGDFLQELAGEQDDEDPVGEEDIIA